ncbi:hypothetical protein MBLNU13_g01435t1 [Cladosporium sp. NU13]
MLLLPAFAALLAFASAQVEVTLCSDAQCKEPPLAAIMLDNTTGCYTDFPGYKVLGITANQAAPEQSQNVAVRFYRSNDCFAHCGSNHLISQMPAARGGKSFQSLSSSRHHPVLQSFELVNVDKDGNYPPHGYCGIRHGDAQYFRGRTWKWQQVGRNAFREIPIEEWDDGVHTRQTSRDYVRHGTVDADGKYKWQQVLENAWSSVPLEEWDEKVHVRKTEKLPFRKPVANEDL